uniref:Uncharacterized protein n=1 Tax=Zea mays TaxID=4577 RepID=C0P4K5_MAIZE|nr:unknown [Zea mays]ACR34300.1 unknown [Zea mays]
MTDGELLWRASFTPAVPILTRMEGCLHVPHARAGAAQGVPHYYIYVHALSANFTFESIFSQRQIPSKIEYTAIETMKADGFLQTQTQV